MMDPEGYPDEMAWQDSMDFEDVVRYDLEEDDDMNAEDAAYMRGFLDETHRDEKENEEVAHTGMFEEAQAAEA